MRNNRRRQAKTTLADWIYFVASHSTKTDSKSCFLISVADCAMSATAAVGS